MQRVPSAGEPRIAVAQAVLGRGAGPDRHHAEHGREVLVDHLGAQLVEVEPLGQRRRERARTVEKKSAPVGGLGLGQNEVGDDLALRRQQRGKARVRRIDRIHVGGDEAVEELPGFLAHDLDHATIGKERCLHV